MTHTTKKQLLAGASALVLVAAVSAIPTSASASTVFPGNSSPVVSIGAVQYIAQGGNADKTLTINDTGAGAGTTFSTGGNAVVTGTTVGAVVNITEASGHYTSGIVNSSTTNPNDVAIATTGTATDGSATGTAGTFATINLTGGKISSVSTSATDGTIDLISSGAQATNINVNLPSGGVVGNSLITNSGQGGNTIYINGGGVFTGTITNAGTISETDATVNAATAITIATANGTGGTIANTGIISTAAGNTSGATITVAGNSGATITNTLGGSISAGAATNHAIALGSGTSTVTMGVMGSTDTTSTITGTVNLGSGASTALKVYGGTLTGAVTGGAASQTITVAGGTITGAVGGTANVTLSSGAIGGAVSNTGTLGVSGGTLTGAVTTSGVITVSGTGSIVGAVTDAGGLVMNAGTVSGGSVTGAGAITLAGGQINAVINGTQAITQTASTYTSNGNITAASLTVNDGKAFTAATGNTITTSGAVTVGSSTGGSTVLNIGSGAVTATGGIVSSHTGQNTVHFTDNQTLGSGSSVGSSGTLFQAITLTDGKTLSTANNLAATNITIGTGTGGSAALTTTGGGTITGLLDSSSAGMNNFNVTTATTTLAASTKVGSLAAFKAVSVQDAATLDATATTGTAIVGPVVLGTSAGSGGDGTLKLGTGLVSGAITTLTNNKGIIDITANNNLGGNIGASGLEVGTVALSAATTVAPGTNSVYANNITLANATTSILNVASGTFSVGTAIKGATGDSQGTVNINGTQTVNAALGITGGNSLSAINVTNGGVLTLGTAAADAVDLTTVNNGGTLNLGTVTRADKGDLTGAAGSTINIGTDQLTLQAGGAGGSTGKLTTASGTNIDLTMTSNTVGGKIIAAAGALNAGTKLLVGFSDSSFTANVVNYQWLTGDTSNIGISVGNVTGNNGLFTLTDTAAGGGVHDLNVTRITNGYGAVASTSNTQAVGTILNAVGAAGTGTMAAFQGYLDSAPSAAAITNDLKTATPQINQTSTTAIASTTQSLNIDTARLSNLRAGIDTSTNGMAAGGRVADTGLWIEGFGTAATQDMRNGVDGFNANTIGMAVGADRAITDNVRLGASFSYAHSTVDGNGTTISNTDIDSYQVNGYGTYNMGQWYTDGLLGVAYNNYNGDRAVAGTGTANSGDYNGETYTARAGGGYRFLTNNGIDITPNSSLTYYYNHTEGYTESGVGALDNTVGSDNTDALIGKIGVDAGYNFNYNSMLIRPVLRAAYMYDFIGDQAETTAYFTGGGASYQTKDASPARNAIDLGASLNIARTDNLTFSADYDFEAKSQYTSNSGVLRARLNF